MRKVKYAFGDEPETNETGIVFTHYLNTTVGFEETEAKPNEFTQISYLGKCTVDGDMFAAKRTQNNSILVFKGHLNNGTY